MGEKNIQGQRLKLVSSSPICDKKNYGDYVEILHNQVQASEVFNIGIIAPYGAGKSSLIKTYKDTKYNFYNKKKITTISLANFNSSSDDIDSKEPVDEKHVKDIQCSVERSILQQFIYKVKKSKLPHSRLDRIDNRHWWLSLLIAFMMTATIALVCCGALECLKLLPYSEGQNFYYFFGAAALSILCLLFLLLYSRRLNKISIKDIETELCGNDNVSILNTFIDELIYYFKKTKVKVVIIEDLDRFNNTNLFAKLREINFLINNSEIVKQKVTFIYAVKDDLFKTENDRAKFFDYIISLVPVLSFTNARKILDDEIKKLCSKEMWLPESYVYEVSHFINEMRILKNIINDYITYYKILKLKNFPQEDKNIKLFSLVLYKNLRPADFAKLQFEEGILAGYFIEKTNIIKNDIEKLRGEIRALEERKDIAKNISLNSFENLKSLIKGMIIDNNESTYGNVSYQNVKNLTTFKNVTGGLSCDAYYSYHCRIKVLEEKLGDTLENLERAVLDKAEQNLNKIITSIDTKRSQIKELINFSMREFLNLHEDFIKDDLINFLLVNGYISEDYKEFIAHADQELLSSSDSEFVRNVLAKRNVELGKKLDNPINVIREIRSERFSDKYILNYDLIECLLNYNKDKAEFLIKKKHLVDYLCSLDSSIQSFIKNYLNDGRDVDLFIKKIVLNNDKFTAIILQSNEISDEKKEYYVKCLFKNLRFEQIIGQNSNGILANYLCCHKNIIDKIGLIDKKLLQEVALELNLKFKNLNCGIDYYDVAQFCIANNLYEINNNNLEFIACSLKSVNKDEFKAAIITTIYKINEASIIEYIYDNLELLVEEILKSEQKYKESQETLELVLNSGKLSLELSKKFIDQQDTTYNFYKNIDKDILKYLFDEDKIAVDWSNIVSAKKSGLITLTDILDYINRNAHCLAGQSVDEKTIILMLCNDVVYTSLEGFSEFSKAFNIEIKISDITKDLICSILVKNRKIPANESNLKSSVNKPLAVVQMLIQNNNLVDLINTTTFTNKTIESIFLDNELPIESAKKILKSSHYRPESQEAQVKVKDTLISDSIGHCEKALLEVIIKNESFTKDEKLKVLKLNDLDLDKKDLFTLLKIIEPKLSTLKDQKEEKINSGEIDNSILNYLGSRRLYKVTVYQRITKLIKLF
ncbi:MAG: hypothetical protein J1G05_00245 [Clostridiales bacterium]|nr:hypothetical protein [Clostridiales bacterium]